MTMIGMGMGILIRGLAQKRSVKSCIRIAVARLLDSAPLLDGLERQVEQDSRLLHALLEKIVVAAPKFMGMAAELVAKVILLYIAVVNVSSYIAPQQDLVHCSRCHATSNSISQKTIVSSGHS